MWMKRRVESNCPPRLVTCFVASATVPVRSQANGFMELGQFVPWYHANFGKMKRMKSAGVARAAAEITREDRSAVTR